MAALVKEQAEMDKIRLKTHADYRTAKADLELSLSGVRKALGMSGVEQWTKSGRVWPRVSCRSLAWMAALLRPVLL